MASFSEILKNNTFTQADLPEFENELFFEGDRKQRYLVQFVVLLFLATVIAAEGVIEDSTATVIGAMIIAPLMTPILATTAALIMGNGKRAWQSLALVIAGVAGTIIVAAVLGLLTVSVIDFGANSQITARVAPRLTDLIIALAAGTAGAFAMSRSDVANSLPGVAISIALVPPLCVTGISLSAGQWDDALGSFLLFMTNFLSILLAGGLVFWVMGLQTAATEEMSHFNRRKAYRIIAVGVILIAIPLATTSIKVARDSINQVKITTIANEWVGQSDSDFVIKSVLVSGDTADIVISGTDQPNDITSLGSEIQSEIDRITEVDLRYVPSRDYVYPQQLE